MDSSVVSARLIGSIFVEKGLITEEQLEVALEQQRATGERLGEILVEKFGVERLDLASALAEQWAEYERQGQYEERQALADAGEEVPDPADEPVLPAIPTPSVKRPIGEIFIERGLVTDAQLEEALERQRASGARLGEILVASGRLSRLELASALADQWATFQKLRPPAETPGEELPANGESIVLPTPEVVVPAPPPALTQAAAAELTGRVDNLAFRLDQVAAEKLDWKPQVEKTAELLRSRIEHLEEQILSRSTDEAARDDLRSELEELAARIDAIPAPSDEWRQELAQVADNLRIRIERVEQKPVDDQLAELRALLDAFTVRLDSLPAPSEEWRGPVADLTRRIDELPTPSEEWRSLISELQASTSTIGADVARTAGGGEELRASVAHLAARIESLPMPSDDWHERLNDLSGRIDAIERRPGESWGDHIAELAARVDAVPTDAWRPELAEVAENLRTRLERLEQRQEQVGPAAEELQELRSALAAVSDRVEAVPTDAWRPEVAEVAENLRTRLERLEQAQEQEPPAPEELQGLRSALTDLQQRFDALPTNAWRPELAEVAENLRTRLERLEHGQEQVSPAPEELQELRSAIADLYQRVDALPTDAWRPELAAVAENLHEHVERVEHAVRRAPSADDIHEIRAALDVLSERVESAPAPTDEWRAPVAGLEARIDALASDGRTSDLAAVAETLRQRVEQLDVRVAEQASQAAVGEIAERVEALARSAASAEALAADAQALAAQIGAMPAPSEEWRERFADLAQGIGARVDQVEQRLASAVHDDALGGVVSRIDELSSRLEDTSALDDVLHRLAAVAAVAGRVDEVERRLTHEAAATSGVVPALDELKERATQDRGRLERLTELVTELAQRRDVSVVERKLAARLSSLEVAVESQRAGDEVDSLRRQVDDVRALVSAAGERSAHAVAGLRSAIERQVARVDELQNAQAAFERHTEEAAAGRKADLSAVRTRLESIETSVAGATGWQEPVGAANERVDRLETLMIETSASETVERNTEIEGVRQALSERIAALESAQLKKKDLRELREAIARVDARVDERRAQDEASTRAVEEAVREGLAGLGASLAAAEANYLDAGKTLSRSIHGLGRALVEADAHLAGEATVAEAVDGEHTSYVAFAPTAEGYRLVVCDGRTPGLGVQIEIPEYEGVLVVTRVGASPLPFDARPCVYLDHP